MDNFKPYFLKKADFFIPVTNKEAEKRISAHDLATCDRQYVSNQYMNDFISDKEVKTIISVAFYVYRMYEKSPTINLRNAVNCHFFANSEAGKKEDFYRPELEYPDHNLTDCVLMTIENWIKKDFKIKDLVKKVKKARKNRKK